MDNPDGSRAVSLLPTFQKWDGTHQLLSSADFASGNWPYAISQGSTSITLTRQGKSSTQGKVPSAAYEFLPTALKETINVTDGKKVPGGSLTFSLTSTYQIQVSGLTIQLLDASGTVVWQTGNFTAWDAADPPHKYPTPVTGLTYASGTLTIALDAAMLAQATYPLHIDPTWVLKADAFNNWQGTLDHVSSDWGDHRLKIGNFADNFDDNVNEVWTVYSGSMGLSGARARLGPSTEIRTNTVDSWSNVKLHYTANFFATGGFAGLFRYQDANNYYILDYGPPVQSQSTLRLSKVVGGVRTDISPAINVNQVAGVDYDFMLVVRRPSPNNDYFEIWFNGILQWSGYDSQGPGVYSTSTIGFRTYGSSTVDLDNVRTWSPTRIDGVYTSLVRNAGANVPTQMKYLGSADGYNSMDLWINSSWDSVNWGGWHIVKSMAPPTYLQTNLDVDLKQYYQVRTVLRTGNNLTSTLQELDILEDHPPAPTATTNSGKQPWYSYVAGMVNAVSGNLFYSTTDLSIRAKGLGIPITRSYNSVLSNAAGPFGLGTTHNFNPYLTFPTGGNVTLNDGDGASYTFTTLGGNYYGPPRGLHYNLIKNADGTYTMWRPDGSKRNFDNAGKLTTVVDKNGNKLTLAYTSGKLTRIVDDSGLAVNFAYDASNRIANIIDPLGRKVSYQYDSSNRLTQFKDAMGLMANYSYDGTSSRLVRAVDSSGGATRFVYNANQAVSEVWFGEWNDTTNSIRWQFRAYSISYVSGQGTDVTNAEGSITHVSFNSFGNPVNIAGPGIVGPPTLCESGSNSTQCSWDGEFDRLTLTDGRGNAQASTYDWLGNSLTVADAEGDTSRSTWSNVQNPGQFISLRAAVTNPKGFTTNYSYDSKGNLVTTLRPDGQILTNSYDAAGSLTQIRDFRGNTVRYGYDSREFMINRTDAGGNVTIYQNDIIGRRWNTTTPLGFTSRTIYDADDRIAVLKDPMGNFTTYNYNNRGDLIRVTDRNGMVTQYLINITLGKISKNIDAGGNSTSYVYNNTGNLLQLADANNHITSYGYDIYHRQIRVTSPMAFVTRYGYDAAGSLIWRIDADGNKTNYKYDKANRLIQTIYPNGQTLNLTYDKNGNTVERKGLELDEKYTYDNVDRTAWAQQIFLTTNLNLFHNYTYDPNRNRLFMDRNGGGNYTWDANNMLFKRKDNAGRTWTYGYDQGGRLVLLTYPNGERVSFSYDRNGWLLNQTTKKSDGVTVIEGFAYTYDKEGNRLSMREVNGNTTTYAYTKEYRLYKVTYPNWTVERFTYDAVGNRLTRTYNSATITYAYDNDSRLTSSSDGWSYAYDANGNVITRTRSGAATAYGYDYENRLTKVTLPTGTLVQYGYSSSGLRTSRTVNDGSQVRRYGYDLKGLAGPPQVTVEYLGASMDFETVFDQGTDLPLEMIRGGAPYFYHLDGLGSVTSLTDGSQTVQASYRYDAFGTQAQAYGSLSNTYRFTAREWDSSVGLNYHRARYYESVMGRFTSKDPLGMVDGPNLYAYVGSNPVNGIDPLGYMRLSGGEGGDCGGGGSYQAAGSGQTTKCYFVGKAWVCYPSGSGQICPPGYTPDWPCIAGIIFAALGTVGAGLVIVACVGGDILTGGALSPACLGAILLFFAALGGTELLMGRGCCKPPGGNFNGPKGHL